jgi:hypothetical protein
MTPKEYAKELVNKMFSLSYHLHAFPAKQCALIAVNEILNNNCGSHTDESNAKNEEIYCDEYYWQEVKQEIEKL